MPVLHPHGLRLNRSLAIQSPQTVHCTQSRLLSGIPRLLPTPVTTALVLLFRPCLLVSMAICLSFNLRIEENTNLIFLFVFRKGCDNIPWTRRGGLPIPRERNSHSYRAVALALKLFLQRVFLVSSTRLLVFVRYSCRAALFKLTPTELP